MLRGLFDSPAQLLLVVLLVVLLFGAKRLPDAARGLGRSLRIFRSEVKEMKADDATSPTHRADGPEGSTPPGDQPGPVRTRPEPLEGRIVDSEHERARSEQRHDG